MAVVLVLAGLVVGLLAGALLGAHRARARVSERIAARLREVADGVRAATGALDSGSVETGRFPARRSDPEHVTSLLDAVAGLQQAGVRAVGEQRAIGTSYSDVSVSLARRSETLVQRLLNIVEQMELDPANKHLLDDLFRLDHLVTRMRRINTNTMVLSRVSVSRTYSAPLELSDVLFGALAGIEQYQRVTVSTELTRYVRGSVAGDLMGLLTELIDNAAAFSAPTTPVVVTAVAGDGGELVIRVTDRGLGVPPEDVERFRARMSASVVDDLSAVRRVGLMVVARLATRHGLDVVLHPREEGTGTLAKVVVPAKHLAGSAASAAGRPPAASTEVFRERVPAATPAPRTLSPTGRNDVVPVPAGTREPDPVALPVRVPGSSPIAAGATGRRQGDPDGPLLQPAASGAGGWFEPTENPLPVRRRPAGSTAHIGDPTATPTGRYRSRWFSRPVDGAVPGPDGTVPPVLEQDSWPSSADEGWRVVDLATASAPLVDSTSGLPVRTAGANLFPGSVSPEGASPANAPVPPAQDEADGAGRQPFVVRSRLGAYRRGVQQARGPAARSSAGSSWTVMQTSAAADPPHDSSSQDQSSFPIAVRTGT